MSKIGLIISREYSTRVRKKSFIIMTLLGPLLIGGFLTLTIWLSMSETKEIHVLVTDKTKMTHDLFKDNALIHFHYSDQFEKEAFVDSEYDLVLFMETQLYLNASSEKVKAKMLYKKIPSLNTQTYINNQLNLVMENLRLSKYSATPDVAQFISDVYPNIRRNVDIEAESIDSGEKANLKRFQAFVGFFFAILIYMFIFLYGVQVMRGVIEEKTNRIVEIIISSVRPFELMLGKIIGIAFVGLTQFILWVFLTGAIILVGQFFLFPDMYNPENMAATQIANGVNIGAPMNVQDSDWYALIFHQINYTFMLSMFLFYFLGGYLMYSALFAAVGAAVDSESDTQQFMMPITIPLLFGFMISEFAIQNPESNVVFWTSIIPLTSPVVMMVRVPMGFGGAEWQIIVSMLSLIIGFILCTWVAAKIYRTGILMYGKKVSYRELWKWLKYKS